MTDKTNLAPLIFFGIQNIVGWISVVVTLIEIVKGEDIMGTGNTLIVTFFHRILLKSASIVTS